MIPIAEGFTAEPDGTPDSERRRQITTQPAPADAELERLVASRTAELVLARVAAESASRAKSVFLANMSQAIRAPMNGVIGMLEVLLDGRLADDQVDALRTIESSVLALLGVVDDALDVSRIETGQLELERVRVPLAELAEGVCESLLPGALASDVDVSLFISPQVPAFVWADGARLRQILVNISSNAVKFSAGRACRRGRVALSIVVTEGMPHRLALRIDDNGIGMSVASRAGLFLPFDPSRSVERHHVGGSGLGLTICKHLVDRMGGEIGVHSRLGEGSSVSVTLPLEIADLHARVALPDLTSQHCILFDAQAQERTLCIYLEAAGAHVHIAATLAEAVRLVADLSAPVVIQHVRGVAAAIEAATAAFRDAPHAGHLLISLSRERVARQAREGLVLVDGHCLHRGVLMGGPSSFRVETKIHNSWS